MWKREDEQRPTSATTPPTSAPAATPPRRDDVPTAVGDRAVLGSSISIAGELSGGEDLLVQGKVDGKIDLAQHTVTIGRSGRVTADVFAKVIHVEGEVKGNLFGSEQILVHKSGAVNGNLSSPRVALEDGCKFKGSIDMDPQATERARPTRPNLPPPVGERPLTALAK